MKIGLCTWSYNRSLASKKLTFESMISECAKKLRIGGIDIIADFLPKTDKKYLTGIKKLATDLQLTICCLSPGNNFGQESQAARDKEVEGIKKWIEVAYILGAPVVRIFAGWPPAGKAQELWQPMVESIRKCIPPAQEAGVSLAIEHHNGGGYLPSSIETLKLIKQIDSPWVGINLDTGNYQDADIYQAIEDSIVYAPHIHAKIHQITKDGVEQEFDYDKIFTIFKKADYRGFVSVEYEGKEDELEYVPISIEMLKRYAAKYEI